MHGSRATIQRERRTSCATSNRATPIQQWEGLVDNVRGLCFGQNSAISRASSGVGSARLSGPRCCAYCPKIPRPKTYLATRRHFASAMSEGGNRGRPVPPRKRKVARSSRRSTKQETSQEQYKSLSSRSETPPSLAVATAIGADAYTAADIITLDRTIAKSPPSSHLPTLPDMEEP